MTEGKLGERGKGGMYVMWFYLIFIFFKYMSVMSYTDVCFINVAAEVIFFYPLL